MRLDLCTWMEVDDYLKQSDTIIIPFGSHEQHGPMGLIGTDAICANEIALAVAKQTNILVAPPVTYTPAPFNMDFPGTISISEGTFEQTATEIVSGLASQGFGHCYLLNAHGANLAPLHRVASSLAALQTLKIRICSWWDFETVNQLRTSLYGGWEGMHATPSEVAITQATHRVVEPGRASEPPERLPPDFIKTHAGDKHGPPDQHRQQFPDGRVGSHSALARPEHGTALIEAAAEAIILDIKHWADPASAP